MKTLTTIHNEVRSALRAVRNAKEQLEGAEKVLRDTSFELHKYRIQETVAPIPPSPNAGREAAIEAAKKFIEDQFDNDNHVTVGWQKFSCNVQFIVDKEKRTVVAIARGYESKRVRGRGVAKAVKSDTFNVTIGKAIALGRALEVQIPSIVLASPSPVEPKTGDIIEFGSHGRTIRVGERAERHDGRYGKAFYCVSEETGRRRGWLGTNQMVRIVDDSIVEE
jgi:hypothetical protein